MTSITQVQHPVARQGTGLRKDTAPANGVSPDTATDAPKVVDPVGNEQLRSDTAPDARAVDSVAGAEGRVA